MEVENPCNGKCWKICHTSGDCLECLRTRNEINGWWDMTSEQKREVLRKIEQRRGGDLAG